MRTKQVVAVSVLGVAMLGAAISASAHHAFAAEFDASKPVHFTGTVLRRWSG